jgi:hypothetical protein
MPNFNVPKLIRLPSPVDLGWSEHNALGMRQFTPYQEGKTWEDWRDYVREKHPVKYWVNEEFPRWVKSTFVWPFERLRNKVLDHVVPSRRYHLLDLRGIDPLAEYRHGYLDPCQVMWLAGWGSLMRWHRESNTLGNSLDQLHPETPDIQKAQYAEANALVHYWTVERIERDQRTTDFHNILDNIPITPENQAAYEKARDEWVDLYRESVQLEEKMWLRLAALRPFLWD